MSFLSLFCISMSRLLLLVQNIHGSVSFVNVDFTFCMQHIYIDIKIFPCERASMLRATRLVVEEINGN